MDEGLIYWRRVDGASQFNLVIGGTPPNDLLLSEERLLAVLLWIQLQMPTNKRWFPVLGRYINQIGDRVTSFGGDSITVLPSPIGWVPGMPEPEPEPPEKMCEICGKISCMIYDHFGEFEGFIVEQENGKHHRFSSRENRIFKIVREAWDERRFICVLRNIVPMLSVQSLLKRKKATSDFKGSAPGVTTCLYHFYIYN